ncbi:hypothetical protein HFP51_00320 [Parasphingopyxis sp. CP4]|uniref:hypothetical protein n=1 Tax=Parasphingopyxis sp. CP4 TaxID=2724527 RepID=UPI0015A4C091|nr:hypothetical protein [Parasphingopyxis sp. CP4]QLC20762.1 hypothetical protein HFP51_00320 [Parasphingopyxis sp. CP4]
MSTRDEDERPMSADEIMKMVNEAHQHMRENRVPYPDPMLPPWIVFPDYERQSMGWRMGSGEDYWHDFSDWFRALDDQARAQYIAANPEPTGWEGFYGSR